MTISRQYCNIALCFVYFFFTKPHVRLTLSNMNHTYWMIVKLPPPLLQTTLHPTSIFTVASGSSLISWTCFHPSLQDHYSFLRELLLQFSYYSLITHQALNIDVYPLYTHIDVLLQHCCYRLDYIFVVMRAYTPCTQLEPDPQHLLNTNIHVLLQEQ